MMQTPLTPENQPITVVSVQPTLILESTVEIPNVSFAGLVADAEEGESRTISHLIEVPVEEAEFSPTLPAVDETIEAAKADFETEVDAPPENFPVKMPEVPQKPFSQAAVEAAFTLNVANKPVEKAVLKIADVSRPVVSLEKLAQPSEPIEPEKNATTPTASQPDRLLSVVQSGWPAPDKAIHQIQQQSEAVQSSTKGEQVTKVAQQTVLPPQVPQLTQNRPFPMATRSAQSTPDQGPRNLESQTVKAQPHPAFIAPVQNLPPQEIRTPPEPRNPERLQVSRSDLSTLQAPDQRQVVTMAHVIPGANTMARHMQPDAEGGNMHTGDPIEEMSTRATDQNQRSHTLDVRPAVAPATGRAVAHQVAMTVAQNAPGVMELALSPEELGRVRLVMTAQDGVINVLIAAERPETTDLMRRHIDSLAQELRNLGYGSTSFEFSQNDRKQAETDNQDDTDITDVHQLSNIQDEAATKTHLITTGLDLRL